MGQNQRYQKAKWVTLLGALVNVILGVIKIIGGICYQSHALFADGIHSLSDLIADGMVVLASKYGSQDADHSHPYGHQRIETAATLFLSLLLLVAGIGIALDSALAFLKEEPSDFSLVTIVIAGLSILANESLFHLTKKVGKELKSDLILANAWHHRSDALSSIVVLVGLLGPLMGIPYLDPVAAVIVGLMVTKMGINYGWGSIKELVDSSVDAETLEKISAAILQVNGVKKIHQLRTRLMGPDIYVDVHILVDPIISVSEGHYIAQHVHHQLYNQFEKIKDVTVHVDPEDDEVASPSMHLPNRAVLEDKFLFDWKRKAPQITHWDLHYLGGKLSLEIFCAAPLSSELLHEMENFIHNNSAIYGVKVYCAQMPS
jgi:cation diffusion facilitator family transporter